MDVANRVVSYSDLRQKAFQLAATLQKYELSDQPPLTAVFGYRSVTTFAGTWPLFCAVTDMSHCAAEYQGFTALSAQREWKIRSQRNAKAARIWNITSVDPENVKQFLVSKYAAQINAMGLNGGEISDDFDFFLRGVIDSLGILEMISSVEDEFNVRLDLSALDAEQLTILGPFSRYVAETALPA